MKTFHLVRLFWLACLSSLIALALFAPCLASFDPLYADPLNQFAPPVREHPLGLDQLGRDVLSRVIWGARSSLLAAALSTVFAIGLGLAIGGAAGLLGGWVEGFLMRSVDILLAFPGLLLALVAITILGDGWWQAAIAVGLSLAPLYARLVRAAMLSVREELFIEAVYALGSSHWRMLWCHLLPNAMRQLTAMATVVYAWALMNGAALDFLGVTGSPSIPSWGRMISEGRAFLNIAPLIAVVPGVMLTFSVVAVMGLSDSLQVRLG
ncbi:MAG: ABC transporter permease [Anaerolineae bacterium]|nr:ABC transporter permease [Anaerolineae bacterium]